MKKLFFIFRGDRLDWSATPLLARSLVSAQINDEFQVFPLKFRKTFFFYWKEEEEDREEEEESGYSSNSKLVTHLREKKLVLIIYVLATETGETGED